MSGHNKWSKIKNKKAVTDAQKSKIFSKLVKLIQNEAKKCGGDTSSPGLRVAIEKARKENMPNDNIDKAIKKASESNSTMIDVIFECYGPAGVGIVVKALTNNNNRTNAEIKHILSKNGGSLGAQGSVMWNFSKNEDGDLIPNTIMDIDDETGEKLGNLIEALEEHDDVQEVITNAN